MDHPRTPVRDLGPADRARMHGQLRRVLRAAIPAARVRWLTGSRDADGAKCPRCGATLARDRVAGRGTVWCPRCQPREAPAGPGAGKPASFGPEKPK